MTDQKPEAPAPTKAAPSPPPVAGTTSDTVSGGTDAATTKQSDTPSVTPVDVPSPRRQPLDLGALKVHENIERSLRPQRELQQTLRHHQEIQRVLEQARERRRAMETAAAAIHRATAVEEASGMQAMMREIAASARQQRQLIESMALSTAMQHSLAQLQKTRDDDAYQRYFEYQKALLADAELTRSLSAVAKQALAISVDRATSALNVPAQLSAVFAQQRQRGVDTLAVFNALHTRPTVSASLAATLAGLVLADAPQERQWLESVLRRVAGEVFERARTATPAGPAAPAEPSAPAAPVAPVAPAVEMPADVEAGDVFLATLVTDVWAKVVEQLRGLTPEMRVALFIFVAQSILQVGSMVMQWQQGVQGTLDHAEEMRAIESVASAVHAQTELASRQQRFIATRAKPLRANPEGSAERVGTVPVGATVVVRYRVDRWLFVTVHDGESASSEGWVFLRDLQPVTAELR